MELPCGPTYGIFYLIVSRDRTHVFVQKIQNKDPTRHCFSYLGLGTNGTFFINLLPISETTELKLFYNNNIIGPHY